LPGMYTPIPYQYPLAVRDHESVNG